MAIFNFIATKTYYICNVYGNTITINNTVSTPIDVSLLSSSELRMLALGVSFQDLTTNDNVAFETYYTGVLGDITSGGSGSTSKEQIQDTVAEMLENGTLITSDYDDNDGTIQLTPLPGVLIKDYVSDTSGAVHINGGEITPSGGVSFTISAGDGYAKNTANEIVKVEWPSINDSCQFNGNNFIGIDYNGDIVVSSSQLGPEIIALGYINTAAGNTLITGFSNIHGNGENANYWINQWVRNVVGANVEYGCNISALPSPNQLSINMASGRAWAQFNEINIGDITTFTKLYGSSLGFLINASNPNIIDNVNINDRSQAPGSALVPMTTGFFKKDLVFVTAEGNLYYLTATSEWPTLEDAQKAPMPEAPSSIKAQIIRLAGIVVQKNASIISDIIDIRPMFSKLFETGTSAIPSTAISHNDLTDLNVDSHGQYHNDTRGDIRYYRKTEIDAYLADKADVSHTHTNATTTVSGFMSSSDKAKLDTFVLSSVLDRSNHTGTQDVSTITGLSKSSVGLNNVDNTSDLNKPVSTATQTALNGKSDIGHVHIISNTTGLQAALDSKEPNISSGLNSQYLRGDKSWQTLDKTSVGLANVDNTSDINKPISTAIQTALNTKEGSIASGATNQYWRGDKTWQILDKSAVGLANVDNTSDANKPISTATQTALDGKQATLVSATNIKTINGSTILGGGDLTVSGVTNLTTTQNATSATIVSDTGTDATIPLGNGTLAGLSINDFTTAEKSKLGAISGTNTGDETQATIKTKLGAATALVDGYLTSTDWNTFNGKQNFIAAGTVSQYRRGDNTWATLDKSAVGLSNVANADTTNASNISSGTLANARLTTNLSQIGNETFANGEVVQSFGGILQNASLASGVTGMSITNSAGQILFDAPYAKGPLNQKSGIFEDFITYSATVISPYLLRTVSGFGATTSIAPALSSGDIRNGVIVFSTGTNSGGAAGAASGSLSSINFANIPEGGYEEVGFNFRIPILPDSTQQFLVNMGFGDSAFGGIPTDGAYISIGHTSGNATANTRSNSSGTTYHNIAISANTDTTARVRVSRISGLLYATYFINGASMGAAIPTNIPSGASREVGIMFGINKFAGNTPRTIELDWIYYESFKPRTINY
ncbi:hypothetical protein [uncultured Flavobacterium sp.]|uniref:hypothetical protein n=1 Tax=uncultured Flavobacterium sp. TaxID=165435 RepID=UPI0025934674|nr:hypothetical protein [uncultured Flavobacterium sp.]